MAVLVAGVSACLLALWPGRDALTSNGADGPQGMDEASMQPGWEEEENPLTASLDPCPQDFQGSLRGDLHQWRSIPSTLLVASFSSLTRVGENLCWLSSLMTSKPRLGAVEARMLRASELLGRNRLQNNFSE